MTIAYLNADEPRMSAHVYWRSVVAVTGLLVDAVEASVGRADVPGFAAWAAARDVTTIAQREAGTDCTSTDTRLER